MFQPSDIPTAAGFSSWWPLIITGIVSLIVALIAGLTGGAVIVKLLSRPKDKADTKGRLLENAEAEIHLSMAEVDAADRLKLKVHEMVKESLTSIETIQRLNAEKAGADLLVKVKDGQLNDLGSRMSDVLIQVGRFQQSEETCRRELMVTRNELKITQDEVAGLKSRLDTMSDHEVILGQNLQMRAILRDLRLQGQWSGNEESL